MAGQWRINDIPPLVVVGALPQEGIMNKNARYRPRASHLP